MRLIAVLACRETGDFAVAASVVGDSYPALTPDCPQANWFEREIAEQWGVCPQGHPWLKPIRFHRSYRPGHDAWMRPASDAIAARRDGLLPGRGRGGPRGRGRPGARRRHRARPLPLPVPRRARASTWRSRWATSTGASSAPWSAARPRARCTYMETLAGDTTHRPRHGVLPGGRGPCPAARPRRGPTRCAAIALELERLANHTGDLGALAGDVGYLPTASFCGRMRGDFLNMTALVCGNRFGRGWSGPAASAFDVERERARELLDRLDASLQGRRPAPSNLLWETPSVMARFEETGALSRRGRRGTRAGGRGRARLRAGTRRAVRVPQRVLPPGPHPGLDLARGRRLRPGLRALAGDPALRRLHPRPARTPCRRATCWAAVGPLAARTRSSSPWSRAGAARYATWP